LTRKTGYDKISELLKESKIKGLVTLKLI